MWIQTQSAATFCKHQATDLKWVFSRIGAQTIPLTVRVIKQSPNFSSDLSTFASALPAANPILSDAFAISHFNRLRNFQCGKEAKIVFPDYHRFRCLQHMKHIMYVLIGFVLIGLPIGELIDIAISDAHPLCLSQARFVRLTTIK